MGKIRITQQDISEAVHEAVKRHIAIGFINQEPPEYYVSEPEPCRGFHDSEAESAVRSAPDGGAEKAWVDYRALKNVYSYGNPLSYKMLYSDTLSEGLIRTYPADVAIKHVRSYLHLSDWQIYKTSSHNGDIPMIHVVIPNIGENLEIVKKAMALCGYHLGAPKEDNIPEGLWVKLQFEPEFQEDITDYIKTTESFLWHATPAYNLGKIMHTGLSPRSKNALFDYPGRVYLIKGSSGVDFVQSMCEELSASNESPGNDGTYVILMVDIGGLPDNVRFYTDPNCEFGVFTKSNIPKKAVSRV